MEMFGVDPSKLAPGPAASAGAQPSAVALELDQTYKRFLSARGTTDANSLTNQLVKTILELAIMDGAAKAWAGITTLEEVAKAAKEM